MIDAIDLLFLEIFEQAGVERHSGVQVVAERLFHDQAAEAALLLRDQAGLAQLGRDGGEEAVGYRHIEKNIAAEIVLPVGLGQQIGELLIGFALFEITLEKNHARGDGFPQAVVDLLAAFRQRLGQEVAQRGLPLFRTLVVVIHPDQRQPLRQHAGSRQIVERGHDQPFGEIAIGAENHDGAAGRRLFVRGAHLSSSLTLWAGTRLSTCPPNSLRIADNNFSPKLCSMRERKRA